MMSVWFSASCVCVCVAVPRLSNHKMTLSKTVMIAIRVLLVVGRAPKESLADAELRVERCYPDEPFARGWTQR